MIARGNFKMNSLLNDILQKLDALGRSTADVAAQMEAGRGDLKSLMLILIALFVAWLLLRK